MTVTICTVLTPAHKKLMGLNYELIKILNPEAALSWNVVHNKTLHVPARNRFLLLKEIRRRTGRPKSWPESEEEIAEADRLVQAEINRAADPGEVTDYIPEARVLKGYKPKQLAQELAREGGGVFGDAMVCAEGRFVKYLGSYLHAAGLNTALRASKTRFSIIVDPDFYVVQENWIETIVNRMQAEDLALFGAPWNPRWHQKYRGFPCTHLMAIDHEKIPFSPDLLAPDLVGGGAKYVSPVISEISGIVHSKLPGRRKIEALKHSAGKLWRAPMEDWRQRAAIGASRDTGYGLLERIRKDQKCRFGMATPVFDPAIEGFMPEVVFPVQCSSLVEWFYPPGRRYMPPRGAYSRTGFLERGYPNFRVLNWEEFLLDDKPFAFHVRGELQRGKTLGIDLHPAWLGLCAILEKKGLPIPPQPAPRERERDAVAA